MKGKMSMRVLANFGHKTEELGILEVVAFGYARNVESAGKSFVEALCFTDSEGYDWVIPHVSKDTCNILCETLFEKGCVDLQKYGECFLKIELE